MQHTLQTYVLETFKNAVKYKGLTQYELGEKMNFNKQRVWNYLSGRSDFTLPIYEKFCAALEIPIAKPVENYADLEEPQAIVSEMKVDYDAIKGGIIERYQAERKTLNSLVEKLEIENRNLLLKIDVLEHDLSERDIEIEKLKSQTK